MKGIPKIPLVFASITTDPVASTTTINVPVTSAINFFWFELSLLVIFRKICDKVLYSLLNIISNLSYLFYRFSFWVFYSPVYQVRNELRRTEGLVHTAH